MHFKILILFISMIFNQSIFNRALGEESVYFDSKSYAMGFTKILNKNGSFLIRSNPSLLGLDKTSFNIKTNFSMIRERRSILVKDYFGDFLTYADYVNNDNKYFNSQFSLNSKLYNFGYGFGILPLTSFNYNYIEEIRGSASVEDGDVGIKDPIVGYHNFSSSGSLNTASFGLSYGIKNLNIGLSYHKVLDMNLETDMHVDSLTTEIQNISNIQNYYNNQKFSNFDGFYSIGISYFMTEYLFSFVYEPEFIINQGNSFLTNEGFINYIDDESSTFFEIGLSHKKPEKINFGFSYNPISNKNLTINFELEKNNFDSDTILRNHSFYKLGFEYMLPSMIPVRGGIVYQTSPNIYIPDQSIITFGTAKKIENLIFDIGCSYTIYDFYYPDLFSVQNNQSDALDKISESKLKFLFSLKYLF